MEKGVRKMPKERTPVSQWKFFYTFVFLFPWRLLLTGYGYSCSRC